MTDPASPRTRPTGVELAAMTDADFDAWVHAHSDNPDPASPRSAESRDLRGDVDETPPIEPGHRPAPEVRETLRASMEAWYAAVAARDQKATWRAGNEMHIAIARFLTPPLPDDERLRAAAQAVLDAVEPIPLGPGMSRTPHVGHRHEAVIALRAALSPHPSEPQEP